MFDRGSTLSIFWIVVFGASVHLITLGFDIVDRNWDFDAHLAWAIQFSEAFRDGNLYPRWMPLGNHGNGAPVTLFYSPLFYFLVSLSDFFLPNSWASIQLVVVLATTVAGLATWIILRRVGLGVWSLIGAMAVQCTPMIFMISHFFNGLPWGASFSLYALFTLFTLRAVTEDNRSSLVLVAISGAGLIFCHIVSSIMVFLCLGLSVLIYTVHRHGMRQPGTVIRWGIAVAVAICLAMLYLWPALTSLDLVASGNWRDRYPPDDAFSFPTITAFIFGMRWFTFQWVVPGLLLLSTLVGTAAFRFWGAELETRKRETVWFLLIVSWVSLFLSSEFSYPLWLKPSPLLWVQSPHRFAYVTCLSATIVNVIWLKTAWKRSGLTPKVVIAAPVALSVVLFLLTNLRLIEQGRKYDSPVNLAQLKPYGSYPEYSTAGQKPAAAAWRRAGGLARDCADLNAQCIVHEGIVYVWTITIDRASSLRLPVLYFPAWDVVIDGISAPSTMDRETGLLRTELPAGAHQVSVKWTRLPQERLGVVFSCLGVLLLIGLGRLSQGRRHVVAAGAE